MQITGLFSFSTVALLVNLWGESEIVMSVSPLVM